MPIRLAWCSRLCAFAIGALALVLPAAVQAQQVTPPPPATLEAAELQLDVIDATARGRDLSIRSLFDLGRALEPLRDELRARIAELEPGLAEIQARLRQLGPVPAKDAPAEPSAIAAERAELLQRQNDLDAATKQARVLLLRADQLGDVITERRRMTYARQLMERTRSVLDPMLWIGAAKALPGELQSIGALFKTWGELIWRGGGALALITLALVIVLLGVVVRLLTRWAERYHAPSAKFDNQLSKARAAIAEFIRVAAVTPLVVIAVLLVVDAFVGSEIPPAIEAASNAIGVAVVIASFARGVATGLLALGHPERRMVDLDERAATVLYKHFVWAAYALALTVFAVLLHKIVTGQQIVADAMHALFALGVLGLLVRLLMSTNPDQDNGGGPDEPSRPRLGAPWLRAVAWLVAIAIVAALVLGYFSLAFFFAERLIATFAIFAAFAMLMVAVDALFTIESPRSRMIAANLGFSQRRVGFVGTLLSGAIRALLMLVALVLIMGPWEVSAADFLQAMKNLAFGFTVGGIQFSLGTIPIAIILLAAILAATRIGQRWLAQKLLPQTDLDLGLQNSIATVFGYLGVITAITVAFGYLGIDLQKIALIAGALSVGIGFGLQSVVSNFVSGLILLGERPIRVGDTIAVKGEEGWVRHIRVRSTEIETFDRATVIIPNSDLITGVVKNWTHATPFGRIIIKVGVGYASDPKTVQEILMSIAEAHKDVLKNPPPNVFFVGFGNSALDFELRCVVRHVDVAMGVKSEINFAILDRFRAAGIEIPYPQHEVRLRDGAGPSKAQPGSPQN